MHHSFDIQIAQKFGVDIAIFLNHIAFWVDKNAANERHYHDGTYWSYNSQKALEHIFPYWSRQNLRTVIKNCMANGLLITGNYNETKYDRTTWYALTELGLSLFPTLGWNQPIEKLEPTSSLVRTNQPIPDTLPDTYTDTKISCSSGDELNIEEESFNRFWEAYPKKVAKTDAIKAWKKIKQKDYEQIISDIAMRKNNNWKGKSKQYIPNAASYLNGQRWNDELTINKELTNGRPENASEKCARILTDDLRKSYQRQDETTATAINLFLS